MWLKLIIAFARSKNFESRLWHFKILICFAYRMIGLCQTSYPLLALQDWNLHSADWANVFGKHMSIWMQLNDSFCAFANSLFMEANENCSLLIRKCKMETNAQIGCNFSVSSFANKCLPKSITIVNVCRTMNVFLQMNFQFWLWPSWSTRVICCIIAVFLFCKKEMKTKLCVTVVTFENQLNCFQAIFIAGWHGRKAQQAVSLALVTNISQGKPCHLGEPSHNQSLDALNLQKEWVDSVDSLRLFVVSWQENVKFFTVRWSDATILSFPSNIARQLFGTGAAIYWTF